ncbi:MAG: competence/damage-inducible protein A [Gemmatimonadota bacterium]
MQLELITIGTELLLGHVLDGNSAWLGRRLAERGLRVTRRVTVSDDHAAIRHALEEALERAGTVLCTGGLGPTSDDITREAAAAAFGLPLEENAAALASVEARFAALGRVMNPTNRIQALAPPGARVLANPRGTAPGLVLEDRAGRMAVLLPGVPEEMRGLMEDQVMALLEARAGGARPPVRTRTVRTTGLAESEVGRRVDEVAAELAPLDVAYLPHAEGVDVRLTEWGTLAEAEALAALDTGEARVREVLGARVYGIDEDDLAAVMGGVLEARGLTLAVAESCTGGLLAQRLTDRPGASAWFHAGFVTYDNRAKEQLLGVAHRLLAEHGAVSEPVAAAMALGAVLRAHTDVGLSITGIAGPGGGSAEKPVGTVWLAAALGSTVETRLVRLPGERAEVRRRAAQAALDLLRGVLTKTTAGV